jgi:hypothetical protein
VAAYDAAREAEKQKAEAQNTIADSGTGEEQNTTAAPTEEEIKQWYSDAYLKNAKKYIEPDQLTLEQWQELIKEFNDLQVYNGRDLYLIPEPDLLSLAKPLPEDTSKKQLESCAVNWNQAASLSDNDTLSFTKPEIVPLPNTDLIPSLAQQVLVDPIPQHNSDTWWGKVLGWVDNHQAFSSIAVGTAIGVSVALILLTAGAATPLIAAGWSAAISGAVIAGGTVGLNAYYGRDLGNRVIRNTLLGVLSSGLAGATTYFVASGGFMMAYLKTTNGIAAICVANPAACTNTEGMMKTADSIEKIGLGIKYTIQIAVGDQAGANETAIEIYSELLTGGVPGDTSYREIKEVIDSLGEDGAELIDKYGVKAVPLLYDYGEKAIDIIGAYGDDGVDLLLKYGDDVVDLIEDYQTPVVTMLVNSANPVTTIKNLNLLHASLTSEAAELAIEQGEDAIGALSHWGAADLATYGDELVMRASSDADAIARATKIVSQVQSIEDLNNPEVASSLQAIASDSTMTIGQSEHFVIGKWDNGLNGGYANEALVNGGKIYYTNPKVSELINSIDDKKLQAEIYKKINQFAIQPAIDKHLPFELTLSGMPTNKIEIITSAIEQIATGNIDNAKVILQKGGVDYSSLFEELEILNANGYNCKLIGGSFIWQFP